MKYSDDVLEYEQIFVEKKKDRIEKESELMQKIYEEQIRRQSILVETLLQKKESEQKVQEQQEELQRLQDLRRSDIESMGEMTKRLKEQTQKMDGDKTEFQREKMEFESQRAKTENELKEQ